MKLKTLESPLDSKETKPVNLKRNQSWIFIGYVMERANSLKKTLMLGSEVKSLSRVWLFVTPWTVAYQAPLSMRFSRQEYWSGVPLPSPQASLSIINSQSLHKLMPIELVLRSNHLILCHPLLLPPSNFPNIRVFSVESDLQSGGQNIGVPASTLVLPMNTQDFL